MTFNRFPFTTKQLPHYYFNYDLERFGVLFHNYEARWWSVPTFTWISFGKKFYLSFLSVTKTTEMVDLQNATEKNIWWTSTFLWRSPPHSIEVPPRLQRKEFDKVFVNKAVNRMREFSSWASDEAALQKGTHWHDEPAQSIQAPDFICRKPGKVANELLRKMENTKKEAGEIKQLILSIFGN